MKAVIMAGGKGTRLWSIAKEIPKPMVPILDKPILEYQIESLKMSGVLEIIIIVGYQGEVIQKYFGDGGNWGVKITYITEQQPLGTAGALYYLKEKIMEDFVLVFGDLILDVDFNRFMDFHRSKHSIITLYGHPNSHPYDSDLIVVDENSKITKIVAKQVDRNFYYHNFVNAGIYCMSYKLLDLIKNPNKMDLEKELITELIPEGVVYAYRSTEYVKDMGTPERLNAVSKDVENSVVTSRNLKNKQKAIFLDRDGTINILKGFLHSVAQFELLPDVAEAISKINASPYLAIVATNQPVIARGECSLKELERIHQKMETELGRKGAYLDDVFFCPHHPHKGYAGEIPELKFDCDCRKPRTGMLAAAAQKYNLDFSESWYIGDTTVDIQTGVNAGMRTILLKTGEAGKDGKYNVTPDYIAPNLKAAINYILNVT